PQSRIGIIGRIADHVVTRARGEFAHYRGGQHLVDAIRESLVFKRWNGDGGEALRKLCGMSSGVIPTGCGHPQQDQEHHAREFHHWIFPVGRAAVMLSAHSTAVTADIRRLSAAAHNQAPFGSMGSILAESWTSACPAALTLLGESSSAPGMAT